MPTEKQVDNIDELVSQLTTEPMLTKVFIDTSIKEEIPDRLGFPMHFKYRPQVAVRYQYSTYLYSAEESEESPDHEAVRAFIRVRALEIGLELAGRLADTDAQIKINDLPLDQAKRQLDIYQAEFARIQEAHKNYGYK